MTLDGRVSSRVTRRRMVIFGIRFRRPASIVGRRARHASPTPAMFSSLHRLRATRVASSAANSRRPNDFLRRDRPAYWFTEGRARGRPCVRRKQSCPRHSLPPRGSQGRSTFRIRLGRRTQARAVGPRRTFWHLLTCLKTWVGSSEGGMSFYCFERAKFASNPPSITLQFDKKNRSVCRSATDKLR
jgi:hypothetical protein